jgi:hypothetical protein
MSSPIFDGYTSKTFRFKSTEDGDIHAEVTYPENPGDSPATVLIHYHGGFLVSKLSLYQDAVRKRLKRTGRSLGIGTHFTPTG